METKNLCAKIPIELHAKVSKGKEESGLTLNEYVNEILTEFYNNQKGGKDMSETTRTLAFQVSEDLFDKLKLHLKRIKISQKDFVIGLIMQALEEATLEADPDTGETGANPEPESTPEEAGTNPEDTNENE